MNSAFVLLALPRMPVADHDERRVVRRQRLRREPRREAAEVLPLVDVSHGAAVRRCALRRALGQLVPADVDVLGLVGVVDQQQRNFALRQQLLPGSAMLSGSASRAEILAKGERKRRRPHQTIHVG